MPNAKWLNIKIMYSCDECDFTTHRSCLLKVHKEGFHEGNVFTCNYCPSQFSYKSNIWNHIQTVHNKDNIKCNKCDYVGKSKRVVEKHAKMIHERNFSCRACDFTSGYMHMVKKHERYKHQGIRTPAQMNNSVNCDLCSKTFKGKSNLTYHKQRIHENITPTLGKRSRIVNPFRKIKCSVCDTKFSSTSELSIHFKTVHGNIIFYCDKCDYNAQLKTTLLRHKHRNHNKQKQKDTKAIEPRPIGEYEETNYELKDEFIEDNISDDSGDEEFDHTRYLCPVTSCIYSIKSYNLVMIKSHVEAMHPNSNLKDINFIKL